MSSFWSELICSAVRLHSVLQFRTPSCWLYGVLMEQDRRRGWDGGGHVCCPISGCCTFMFVKLGDEHIFQLAAICLV